MIIICELQCTEMEHVEVNAALICSIRLAYPEKKILFLAQENHLQYVKESLEQHGFHNIEFTIINVPERLATDMQRFIDDYKLCKQIFDKAVLYKTDKIIFCSIMSTGLIALKFLLKFYSKIKCFVIPHGILETIIKPPSSLRRLPFWFKWAMAFGNNDKLTYLLLGKSIQDNLKDIMPHIMKYTNTIDIPYFYKSEYNFLPFKEKIKFGLLGIVDHTKGSDLFFKFTNEIGSFSNETEFYLIGRIVNEKTRDLYFKTKNIIAPSPDKSISRQEYDKYVSLIDYSVFFYHSNSYKLKASGVIFDAFSFLKPIIALRNPFFEYYFEIFGDIGYLCNDYDELKQTVYNIIENPPAEKYAKQVQNLVKGREMISVENLACKFKNILD